MFRYVEFRDAVVAHESTLKNSTVRGIANRVKLSPATVQRIIKTGRADLEPILKMCAWIGRPITDFVDETYEEIIIRWAKSISNTIEGYVDKEFVFHIQRQGLVWLVTRPPSMIDTHFKTLADAKHHCSMIINKCYGNN